MKLESIGRVLASGFGDRVALGVFMGLLESVTPYRLYEYLKDDLKLGYWVSDDDWLKYKKMAKGANISVTTEDVINDLRENRPDLLGVLLNYPGGMTWLDEQVVKLKKKLGLE